MKESGLILCGILTLIGTCTLSAANCYTQTEGKWSDDNIWSAVPGDGDNVIVCNNISLDKSPVSTFKNLTLSECSKGTAIDGTLTITSGCKVRFSGSIAGARNFPNSGNGTLIIDGGSLEGGAMHAGNGASNTSLSKVVLKNGASFVLERVINLGGVEGQRGELHIIGSGNTFKVKQLMVRERGHIVFVADAQGFSTAKSTERLRYGTDKLLIDGSAYTGPSSTITLLSSESGDANYNSIDLSATISGFASAYNTRLFVDGSDLKLEIIKK